MPCGRNAPGWLLDGLWLLDLTVASLLSLGHCGFLFQSDPETWARIVEQSGPVIPCGGFDPRSWGTAALKRAAPQAL
jgi:hypothetical protein